MLPGDGRVYYTKKGPDNSDTIKKFEGFVGYRKGYGFEPVSCICCGGGGYDIYYRMRLATGETEKVFKAAATSTLTEPGKPADYLGPEKAIDGDIATAWVEGADGRVFTEEFDDEPGLKIIDVYTADIPGGFRSAG